MTSILISKPPEQVANILNGRQSAIILKTVPKDWADYLSGKTKKKPEPMTGYIYCTQGKNGIETRLFSRECVESLRNNFEPYGPAKRCRSYTKLEQRGYTLLIAEDSFPINGKVCAKFTLREVDRVPCLDHFNPNDMEQTSLTWHELHDYVGDDNFYAWHISDLQIFDKPKELSEFMIAGVMTYSEAKEMASKVDENYTFEKYKKICAKLNYCIKRAPQSWRYVEYGK